MNSTPSQSDCDASGCWHPVGTGTARCSTPIAFANFKLARRRQRGYSQQYREETDSHEAKARKIADR